MIHSYFSSYFRLWLREFGDSGVVDQRHVNYPNLRLANECLPLYNVVKNGASAIRLGWNHKIDIKASIGNNTRNVSTGITRDM